MLIRDAEVEGRRVSLRCMDGVIIEFADRIDANPGEEEIDAGGGALLPGLHDHHLHLFSLAARFASVSCGPPAIESREDLADALRSAEPGSEWIRGTGYFESVAGALDRERLDAFGLDRPLRIQHRSGSMWFLNSLAIEALDLDRDREVGNPGGIERDEAGRVTGRLFRADDWLRQRLPASTAPDLSAVGSFLARRGVTRVTDATPSNGPTEAALFRAAQQSGALPQRIRMMGDLSLGSVEENEWLEIAEYKILLDEPALPDLGELAASIASAHGAERSVAIHTVTRIEIHFALAAIEAAGARIGDRLEHASVAPLEAFDLARRLGVSIVTQPNFIAERGDAYRKNVDARDRDCLYRVRSWLDSGVPLAAGTDAPFGDPDPWRAIRAAVERRTASGNCLGQGEMVSPEIAVGLFGETFLTANNTTASRSFGRLSIGQRADLCLLNAPWREVREELSSDRVAATICAGQVIWSQNA